MAIQLVTWALGLPITPSSAKFVLVVLADAANLATMNAFCSVGHLAQSTCQDRKTVIANLQRLAELGYIEDTGDRVGRTGQVIVYALKEPTAPGCGTQLQVADVATEQAEPDGEKRNSTVFPIDQRVPKFPPNSPVFPGKQSRFSAETVPKTVPGTVRNRKVTKSSKELTFDQWVESLPEDADAIPLSDPIYGWAKDAGIPEDFLTYAWLAFEDNFTGKPKTYAEWKGAFRNYVKKGWLQLWARSREGGYYLTTVGEQWRQVRDARDARAQQEAA